MTRITNNVKLRQFMKDSEGAILSVESLGNDDWRMILVWVARNRKWYIKVQGEDYVRTMAELADKLADGDKKEIKANGSAGR